MSEVLGEKKNGTGKKYEKLQREWKARERWRKKKGEKKLGKE